MPKTCYTNISQLITLKGVAADEGRHPSEEKLTIISEGAVVVDDTTQRINWVGSALEIPKDCEKTVDCNGETWFPEFIECHTHLIFAGERSREYKWRCSGVTYQDIAARGGGILNTLQSTRVASIEKLVEKGLPHLETFRKKGVGTIEIKSGYGLTLESELKILEVIERLRKQFSGTLFSTLLAAHAVPPEFKDKADDYVNLICAEWIPEVARQKKAQFFDVFIEEGFFSLKQGEKLCTVAKDNGFQIKLHVDQFNDLGGSRLGVEIGAVSVDHLDHISEISIERVAKSKTVAVLCPGASLFVGTPYPPARKLIDRGGRVAISTDFNAGTCTSRNLPLMATLACSQMKMTPAEAITAMTYNAAAALGIEKTRGSIEVGKDFRVTRLHIPSYESVPYFFGEEPI